MLTISITTSKSTTVPKSSVAFNLTPFNFFPYLLYNNQASCSHKRLCYILIDAISCYNLSLSTSKFATPSSHTSSGGSLKTQPFYCSSFTYLVKRVHFRKDFSY